MSVIGFIVRARISISLLEAAKRNKLDTRVKWSERFEALEMMLSPDRSPEFVK